MKNQSEQWVILPTFEPSTSELNSSCSVCPYNKILKIHLILLQKVTSKNWAHRDL